MGEGTKIQWCSYPRPDGTLVPGYTWSPWRGCTKVSEGCRFCYAEAMSKRNPKTMGVWGPNGHRAINADWAKPLRWNGAARKAGERRRVFPSLCDVFEDREDLEETRDRFFATVLATPHLDWLVLTKRPEQVAPYFRRLDERRRGYWHEHAGYFCDRGFIDKSQFDAVATHYGYGPEPKSFGDSSVTIWPLPNVWIGTSVENQQTADERIPELLKIPATVRWLSIEPLLGAIRIGSYFGPQSEGQWMNVVECGHNIHDYGIQWVVIGGESGPHARPCDLAWVRALVNQCRAADVPPYVKQLGSNPVFGPALLGFPEPTAKRVRGLRPTAHPKGGDPDEWPDDLRVREFPTSCTVEAP